MRERRERREKTGARCLPLLVAALALAPELPAQLAPMPRLTGGLSVAMVVSGGASLGVYEAGYTYLLGELLKRQGIPLRVATGASAGSGNALFAALNSCSPANDLPTQDLGYRFWIAQSFDRLFQRDSSTPVSALIATPGVGDLRRLLDTVWQDRLPAWCNVALGIPVTRLRPLDVPLQDQLTVPRQLLHFTVRIRGRGDTLPPRLQNIVVPDTRVPQLLLPLAGDSEIDSAANRNRDLLLQVIAASGAFPFAFPPVTIGYCLHAEGASDECREADRHDPFIDGGVFDNIPLGLATTLNDRFRLRRDTTLFVYLNPDLRAYPLPTPSSTVRPLNAFDHGAAIARGFVRQSRETELFDVLEDHSAALGPGRLLVASSRLPQASGFLGNFLGLFEREFRRFDYYLGMYDALGDVAGWSQLNSARGRQAITTLLATPEWQPLQCLIAWYDSTAAAPPPGCAGEEERDFRILAQVAINRVYSQCRELSQEQSQQPIANYHCRMAASGVLPPRIAEPSTEQPSTWVLRKKGEKESELEYNLRLLSGYGFDFHDLGVPPGKGGDARRALARRLREVVGALAERQPTRTQRRAIRLGTLAVGLIYYEPPPSWWYLVAGTAQEVGGSQGVSWLPDWVRLNGAFRVKGIVSLVTQDPNKFAAGVFVGPDIELRPLTRPTHMITIAPRVGYQLSQGDRFHSRPCDAARTHGDRRDCSQVVFQAVTSIVAIERIRLQVSLDYFHRKVDFDNRSYDIQLALGAQF